MAFENLRTIVITAIPKPRSEVRPATILVDVQLQKTTADIFQDRLQIFTIQNIGVEGASEG